MMMTFVCLFLMTGASCLQLMGDWSKNRACSVLFNKRQGCGQYGVTELECINQGCCWKPAPKSRKGVPWCFRSDNNRPTSRIVPSLADIRGSDGRDVEVKVEYQHDSVRIVVDNGKGAKVPSALYSSSEGYPMPKILHVQPRDSSLNVNIESNPLQITVRRSNNGPVLFDTRARSAEDPFDSVIIQEDFVEFGTRLSRGHYIYGLGQRVGEFRKKPNRMAINTRDPPTALHQNTYGAHPFYLQMQPDGTAHGVLFLNSHPMDTHLTDDSLVYRALGGMIDLHIFAGPTADLVMEQYTRVIGRPPLYAPPFYGYHHCKFGYRTLRELRSIIKTFDKKKIPLDGIWLDIDYMEAYTTFTNDPLRYPQYEMQQLIEEQRKEGRIIVPILDPIVPIRRGLYSYEHGEEQQVYMKDAKREQAYKGSGWPGKVHFIDFVSERVKIYWSDMIRFLRDNIVSFDGLWTDMSEPADFTFKGEANRNYTLSPGEKNLNYPPYAINNGGIEQDIFLTVLPMDVRHTNNVPHLAYHNLYGASWSLRTAQAMEHLEPGRRHFLLGRSTFPGSGRFTATWLGDNSSDFVHLKYSIAGMMDFQLFGISMVGADICGFSGGADEELCARWLALGSFYPFARNHNDRDPRSIPQEPYQWKASTDVARKYFGFRYSIFPYWYKLGRMAHETGRPMIRPMFFDFPQYPQLYDNYDQFMVGSSLLVAPVLYRTVRSVNLWLPQGVWYDALDTAALPLYAAQLRQVEAVAKVDTIPVLLRGGHIMLRHPPKRNLAQTIKEDYFLVVPFDLNDSAQGQFYFDDGITANPRDYSNITFRAHFRNGIFTLNISGHFGHRVQGVIRKIIFLYPQSWPHLNSLRTQYYNAFVDSSTQVRFTNLDISLDAERNIDFVPGTNIDQIRSERSNTHIHYQNTKGSSSKGNSAVSTHFPTWPLLLTIILSLLM